MRLFITIAATLLLYSMAYAPDNYHVPDSHELEQSLAFAYYMEWQRIQGRWDLSRKEKARLKRIERWCRWVDVREIEAVNVREWIRGMR